MTSRRNFGSKRFDNGGEERRQWRGDGELGFWHCGENREEERSRGERELEGGGRSEGGPPYPVSSSSRERREGRGATGDSPWRRSEEQGEKTTGNLFQVTPCHFLFLFFQVLFHFIFCFII